MPAKKLLYFVTEDWYFCSHRLELAKAAKQAGYEVTVVTQVNHHGDRIREAGLQLLPLRLSRRSLNPLKEVGVLWCLVRIYREVRPDLVHHVALKPVVYGTLAARLVGVRRVVNAVAGLGFVFSAETFKARALRLLLRPLLRGLMKGSGKRVIVQNPIDRDVLCQRGLADPAQVVLIPGSGVDTEYFRPFPELEAEPVVILASRLLWQKGVGVFVKAARQLLSEGVRARFVVVGEGDDENPSSISRAQLQAWDKEEGIEWWGRREDMPGVYAHSHVVCLPSYYGEGVPKALIEAAACGRPIVTTDTPGCRDIVENGVNGYLVPVRDSMAVAHALRRLLESSQLRAEMGKAGRERVCREFGLDKVIAQTLGVYGGLDGL